MRFPADGQPLGTLRAGLGAAEVSRRARVCQPGQGQSGRRVLVEKTGEGQRQGLASWWEELSDPRLRTGSGLARSGGGARSVTCSSWA